MASAELKQVIERYRQLEKQASEAKSPQEVRAVLNSAFSGFPSAGRVKCEPVMAGDVKAEWISAPEASEHAILYLHGGGYAAGSIETHRELCARLSQASSARCLAIDYRLAPEHPFPAAVEDATAAYRWMLAQGINAKKIAIAGDSAGGGLTIATLVALRDGSAPIPAAGVCISPWVDLEATGDSMTSKASEDPVVSRDVLLMFTKMYIGDRDPKMPLASPLHADLRGLPPLLIQVGSAEVLLDDSARIAERARAAGVQVEMKVWPDMPHVWHWFAPTLPEARQAIDKIGAFVRQHSH